MNPTDHEKAEWARCAKAMYAHGVNGAGHFLSALAALPRDADVAVHRFDMAQSIYRDWLNFNTYPDGAWRVQVQS